MKNENFEYVKSIAKELEAIVNGEYLKHPDYEAERVLIEEYDDGEKFVEIDGVIYREYPENDDEHDIEELEQYTLWDYLTDVYDIEYTLDTYKEYKAIRLMIACGGPNIYLNTKSGDVELYWWTEKERYPMRSDVIEALDEYGTELFNC